MTKFCPKCGEKLKDNDQFCVNCGHKLKNNSIDDNKINNENKEVSKSNINSKKSFLSNNKVKYGLIALIAIIAIIAVLFVVFGSGISHLENYNIKITETSVSNYSSEDYPSYSYDVNALISPVPNNGQYIMETEFFDSNGNSLYISTSSVSDLYLESGYSSIVGSYMPDNYQNISKVTVRLFDSNGNVLGENSTTFNMNDYKDYSS